MTRSLFFVLVCFAIKAFMQIGSVHAQWTEPVLMDDNTDTLGINTESKEWCPFISADSQFFYFVREHINNDIYVCHRTENGWSAPLKLPFCTDVGDERNLAVNATNDTLYFVTFSGGWDLFWSFRTGPFDTSWSSPERMPEPINSTGIEFSVWCTPDNQRLLFSSWRIGANGEDIYECRRDANTPTGWSEPAFLPGRLHTFDIESYPSMGPDTTEIFFWGRNDQICTSQWTDSGWTFGTPLPPHINRTVGQGPTEKTPCITPDGSRLYFMSRWNGDSMATAGDIWYSDRTQRAEPQPRGGGHYRLQINVYPNPARENLWIDMDGSVHRTALYDVLGREIITKEFSGYPSLVTWNLHLVRPGLAAGTYFLTAENGKETKSVRIQILK